MESTAALAAGLKFLRPEIALLATAALGMFAHLFLKRHGARIAGYVTLLGLLVTADIVFLTPLSPGGFFSGTLTADKFAFFFTIVFLIAAAMSVGLAFRFFEVQGFEAGEFYYLLPLALIGMTAAVSATDLITLYVAFELFAIPSYVLTGIFKKEARSSEASIKYFFLGTLSSGLMLLGMALIYGLTGETGYAGIARLLPGANAHIALVGMILFFAGLAFKAALAPFQMWAPDVYEGAPTPIVVFLSTASKAAVFAILIRLMVLVFAPFQASWSQIFQFLALVSMFWGNLAALVQTNIKRMMAYSSIAHAGYIAIGLAAWGEGASTAVLYYLVVYLFMNAAAFSLVLIVRRGDGFGESVDDLRGLARRAPLAAASVLIVLLSLTGIPPTAGFLGKYLVFMAAVDKGLIWLAAAGALNAVISLFYYFRIGRAMFMEDPAGEAGEKPAFPVLAVIVVSAAALLLLGILPSPLLDFVSAAFLK
jgi:NADH-quinone oxidoreductase subunit N